MAPTLLAPTLLAPTLLAMVPTLMAPTLLAMVPPKQLPGATTYVRTYVHNVALRNMAHGMALTWH